MAATLGPGSLIRLAQCANRRDGAASILLRNGIAVVASTLRGPRLFEFAFSTNEAALDRYLCLARILPWLASLQCMASLPLLPLWRVGMGEGRQPRILFSIPMLVSRPRTPAGPVATPRPPGATNPSVKTV